MTSPRSHLDQLLSDMQPEIDELRVKLHLAKKEAQEEFAKWETRVADYRSRTDQTGGEAGDIIEEKAKAIAVELKDGFDRLRKLFQNP